MSDRTTSVGAALQDAEALHNAAMDAAYRGDMKTADAWRLLEGNARGGDVMRKWTYRNLLATEAEIRAQAQHLAIGWGASEEFLHEQAMSLLREAVRA